MNCKPGDLAIIVRSTCGNEGRIVRCIRLLGFLPSIAPDGKQIRDWSWVVDRQIPDWSGRMCRDVHDGQLRPIRDPGDDAVDEFARPKHDETLKPKRQLEHC
jgi:hypothetical protein